MFHVCILPNSFVWLRYPLFLLGVRRQLATSLAPRCGEQRQSSVSSCVIMVRC